MQTAFEPEEQTIDLLFDSDDELERFVENARRRGLLLVRLAEAPRARQRLSVRLRAGNRVLSLDAKVHQIFRSGATEHGIALRPLGEIPEPRASDEEIAPEETSEATGAPTGTGPNQRSETSGASVAMEIRSMNVSQRMRLATRAGRLERQILLRDNSPQVLMGLLANPRIDEQEVRDLVRSPHAASGVLQHVAKDRRWSGNYEIRLSLVRNPKTPTPLAQRLLPTLRQTDLQTLAKSPNVREAIKGAALRLYLGKI